MIIKTNGLVKNFGGLIAVNSVSLHVEKGEILGLIGPNGAGKTTFLNCISGALRSNGGTVHFLGEETTGASADQLCRMGMSRTFQISRPFPRLTALENVLVGSAFGACGGNSKTEETLAEEALDFVNFPMPKDTPADRLNAVQLKRLDLARALACEPQLLLLDEVSSGLTPTELDEVMDLIKQIQERGITMIVVEHIMRVIMGVSDRIVVLQYGEKIAEGMPDEIANDERVIEAYLGDEGLSF
jgi:branched-chain amino acid transport system ATP-binding protein